MITEIKGDLTEFPEGIDIAVQGCNVHAIQGAGLAKAFQKYPEVHRADKTYRNSRINKLKGDIEKAEDSLLGEYSIATFKKDGVVKHVVNLYQQKLQPSKSGVNLDYNAIWAGLQSLAGQLKRSEKIFKIGFPKFIGCGLAGGNWEVVRTMIEQAFEGTKHEILFVDFN